MTRPDQEVFNRFLWAMMDAWARGTQACGTCPIESSRAGLIEPCALDEGHEGPHDWE